MKESNYKAVAGEDAMAVAMEKFYSLKTPQPHVLEIYF